MRLGVQALHLPHGKDDSIPGAQKDCPAPRLHPSALLIGAHARPTKNSCAIPFPPVHARACGCMLFVCRRSNSCVDPNKRDGRPESSRINAPQEMTCATDCCPRRPGGPLFTATSRASRLRHYDRCFSPSHTGFPVAANLETVLRIEVLQALPRFQGQQGMIKLSIARDADPNARAITGLRRFMRRWRLERPQSLRSSTPELRSIPSMIKDTRRSTLLSDGRTMAPRERTPCDDVVECPATANNVGDSRSKKVDGVSDRERFRLLATQAASVRS